MAQPGTRVAVLLGLILVLILGFGSRAGAVPGRVGR